MSRPGKRRRRCCSASASRPAKHRKHKLQPPEELQPSLDGLPPEVLEMVLRLLPYSEIAGHVRLISRKCSAVATAILNSAFLSFGPRLQSLLSELSSSPAGPIGYTELVMRNRAHNFLELVEVQYNLLRAVVWRYTHPPSGRLQQQRFPRLCFYGGGILDELDALLRTAKSSPAELVDKNYISEFTALCKQFMNYFEKISERRINRSSLGYGCKPVDLLDCLLSGRKLLSLQVSSEEEGTTVSMRMRYVLERAWFTCLEVPRGEDYEEDSWRDKQRFMNLRLRRLVGSVNEHLLESSHYQSELLMVQKFNPPFGRHLVHLQQPSADRQNDAFAFTPKPPTCSTYSGYGECGGKFFHYGNMNEYAFENKVVDMWRKHAARDRMCKRPCESKPNYDLVIDVDLKCSPELAPLAARKLLKCDDFESPTLSSSHRPQMYLKMTISCPASVSNRLPGHFVWEVRSPRRHKKEDD